MNQETRIAHLEQLLTSPGWLILMDEWGKAKNALEEEILNGTLEGEAEKLARIKRLDLVFCMETPKRLIEIYKEVPSEVFTGDPYATEEDILREKE